VLWQKRFDLEMSFCFSGTGTTLQVAATNPDVVHPVNLNSMKQKYNFKIDKKGIEMKIPLPDIVNDT
jgi:hypothetical protein